jgi:predicted transcriptional regulator
MTQLSLVKFRDKNTIEQFANHFKKTRLSLDITQEQLSYKTDVSLSQIARIETAKINPTLCTIIELAKGLEIHPKELLNFDIDNKK